MDNDPLAMRRIMPGLHEGELIRAERKNDGHWAFDMKMRRIAENGPWWFEPDINSPWHPIGSWTTLAKGQQAAELLRTGTHYWEQSTYMCHPYDENAYAQLRGERTSWN